MRLAPVKQDLPIVYWLQAITPVHVGTGQGVGFVDLPIAREKVTGWPVIPGTSLKGVLRDYCLHQPDVCRHVDAIFGTASADGAAGVASVTDARIVLMPVRSLYGTFSYVTSPLVLHRLRRDLGFSGFSGALPDVPAPSDVSQVLALPSTPLAADEGVVYLEEFDLQVVADSTHTSTWAALLATQLFPEDPEWQQLFKERFAIVADDVFQLLCEIGTEVSARVRIEDRTGVVANGGLWYEESLPSEAVLAGMVWFEPERGPDAVSIARQQVFRGEVRLQVGGKATTGKGLCRVKFTEVSAG
ncbi:MAG: type III-B CRISPR module RAMP protein Cmr4 [Thermoflavifilum sp.]|nr:type III-B CRISPR module RAMP protein Cmr4 [Thermoflavifilum sp.]MCL6515184.1 type III-B CRISPR module RAMP protein Cmr4 [Alicyclobacillus sp.]